MSDDERRRPGAKLGRFEHQIAWTFGIFLLLLALLLSSLGGLFHLQDVERERALFAGVIAGTLERSIAALSFGGVYQIRGFVEQTAAASDPLAYLYVIDTDGRFLAHSDGSLNGRLAPKGWDLTDASRLTTQREHEGRSVTEIAMPLRGGFKEDLIGRIHIGIYAASSRELLVDGIVRTGLIFLGIMLLGLPVVLLLSVRLADPMRRLASLLRGILERAPIVIAIFDEEGQVEEASAQIKASIARGELDPLPELYAFTQARPSAEVEISQAKGARIWSAVSFPLHGGRCLIARDVTEERQLARENHQLAAAVSAADDQVIITDVEGVITYVNPAFTRITGFEREEALGETPRILKSAHNDEQIYKGLWGTILRGETWRGRVLNRKKSGDLYQCDLMVSPILREGTLTNFVGIGRDRTRELRLEEQLLRAQRMDAVGRLAGGIAHDFNNLLSVINGHTELLLLSEEISEDFERDINVIASAGRRAAELTQQLLAFSRRQPRNLETIQLSEVILDIVDMISSILGSNVYFDYKLGPETSWFIRGDRGQLEQVILNLCINARDAMSDGGRLLMELERARFAELDTEAPAGDYVILSISDNGVGIPPEVREQIFEPFFTTKPAGKGTGLGLSMVHGVIKQSGGFVWVYSEPGIGTTFKLVFPRSDQPDLTASQAKLPKLKALPTGSELILVVEDQAPVRQTLVKMLSQAGYQIEEAEHGLMALERLEAGLNPDLVLSDLVMPEMGGLEMAAEIRARWPELKIIFMSGYSAQVAESDEALNDAILIRKPATVRELREQVRHALDQPKSP